ncbi:hypothetical protein ACVW0P_003224 [Mucilaginibacter sp. UYNi724]
MGCILRIIGEEFDVDNFILQSGIRSYSVFYKGEPKSKLSPDGKKCQFSGCAVDVSKADFNDFNKQIDDASRYLELYQEKLKLITSIPAIQFAVLDFGIECDINKFVQSKYLPITLIKLCAELGISIELSIYQQQTNYEI